MSGFSVLLQIALRIGGLALVAVGGGNALVPALHEEAVGTMHWLSDTSFTELVALSQAAPGPNMLLMPLIGWRTAGIAGAAVALVAFLLPSSTIAILGSRLIVRHERSRFVAAFKWALRPVTSGLMVSSAIVLVQTAARTWPQPAVGATLLLAMVTASVTIVALRFKLNPLVWLGAAAVIGAIV